MMEENLKVTTEKPGPLVDDYVQVNVRPDAAGHAVASWIHVKVSDDRVEVEPSRSAPLADTWEEAKRHAASAGIACIYVDDPYGAFKARELGLAPADFRQQS
jgi:hypothetical protein